jgi:hypothetical protein
MRSSAAQDAQRLPFVKDLFLNGKFFLTIRGKLTVVFTAQLCKAHRMGDHGEFMQETGFRDAGEWSFSRHASVG